MSTQVIHRFLNIYTSNCYNIIIIFKSNNHDPFKR